MSSEILEYADLIRLPLWQGGLGLEVCEGGEDGQDLI